MRHTKVEAAIFHKQLPSEYTFESRKGGTVDQDVDFADHLVTRSELKRNSETARRVLERAKADAQLEALRQEQMIEQALAEKIDDEPDSLISRAEAEMFGLMH